MRKLGVVALTCTLILNLATSAWAIRIYGASSPGNQTGAADALVDLGTDLDGNVIGDTLQFNVAKKGYGVVTFSGECSVEGGVDDWVSIDIMVNGVAIGQSLGGGDGFCSGNETATSDDGWVMGSMTIPFEFGAGNVDLQVMVTLQGGASGWWIGDAGVSVILQKR